VYGRLWSLTSKFHVKSKNKKRTVRFYSDGTPGGKNNSSGKGGGQGERIKKGVKKRQKKPREVRLEVIMILETVPPIIDFFNDIKDPRIERKKCCPLIEVIAITLLTVMAFAKGWEDIELYGKIKKAWLKRFLPLKQGIPKHDVYRRVFNRLNPRDIERCFMAWVGVIKQDRNREVADLTRLSNKCFGRV
jgi:hypothetical protein